MSLGASYNLARGYRRTQAETARPTQLILMLYDGAIRFLTVARERLAAKDVEGRHTHMIKAQRIISSLDAALDMKKGGEVAVNLHRVYLYMYQQLVEANLRDQAEPIVEVISMLRDLRESWQAIDDQAVQQAPGAVAAARV